MGNEKPRVSIGMPVYNGERFISEAIDSILNQSFTDFELIITDNDSDDRTEEICTTYANQDSRISYHRNPNNLGAAGNYNLTFKLARGEYFKWAAHDDMLEPEFIFQCVHVLDSEIDTVLCYPSSQLLNESDEIYGTYSDNLHLRSNKPHERFKQFFVNQGVCHAVFGLFRSSVLERSALIGNYPASDRVLLGEVSLLGKFHELPEHLFIRRIHPEISTVANENDDEVANWFDPSNRDKFVIPRWRRLYEYLDAIRRAQLGVFETLNCVLVILRYSFVPNRWQGLLSDIKNIARSSNSNKQPIQSKEQ